MADRNLALDIAEVRGEQGILARVYVELACNYRKDGGAPTITADCGSLREFEVEITRLKAECDEMLREAVGRFAEVGDPRAEPTKGSREKPASAVSGEKLEQDEAGPVRLDAGVCVRDRMTREVRTLRRNDKLSLADELMKVGGFRHVVVVEDDGDEVAGVISQRDIFYSALAWSTGLGTEGHRKALESQLVKAVMQADVTTVGPDAPLVDAVQIMLDKRIGCLPVVENRDLVGILTEGDLLALLANGLLARE